MDALEAIRADPAPKSIIRGTHYFISNESKHELWRESLNDLGGILIGVGAEQNYLLAGWARPDVLILMDFDIYIARLHQAYRVAFAEAATPDAMIALWQEKGRERLNTLVVQAYGETGEVQNILKAVKFARSVGRQLDKLKTRYTAMNIPTFLTDQAQYDFIRDLWKRGRVLPIRGDLTGKRTLVDIAAFSRVTGLPVRALYTSNAEYYFSFRKGRYRDNIVGLPFDERSLVLRTDPYGGTKYRFYEQKHGDFVAWLERGTSSNVNWMAKHR
ncbi:MAG: hypothetical protein QF464_23515, partial [Myxococcota bacterium]|nr:hypothetical protein [Myxococcota bacterium]